VPGKISSPGPGPEPGPHLLALSCGDCREAVDEVSSESLPDADPSISFSSQLLLLEVSVVLVVLAAADGELSTIFGCISLGAAARQDLLMQF